MSQYLNRLLIANRGEIAVRIARTAEEQGLQSVVLYSRDDAESRHRYAGDDAVMLDGTGPPAYMDIDAVIGIAREARCDAIHPGYGFLSEIPKLARECERQGIVFIGPRPEVLEVFGDKTLSRELAHRCRVPLVRGTAPLQSATEARRFMESLSDPAAIMIKAIAGGGGRGMRAIQDPSELDDAFEQARQEAFAAFNDDRLYAEQFHGNARHIEVQIAGDGSGNTVALGDRDCSMQHQRQKLVEIAPAPFLDENSRRQLGQAATSMASEVRYRGIATFEFLVNLDNPQEFFFLECNPRIQVEHTVTEETLGMDLVRAQLRLAAGDTLESLDLTPAPRPRGFAVQSRVSLQSVSATGEIRPGTGLLTAYDPPGGPSIRIDDHGYAGLTVPPGYDPLIAKIIAKGPDLTAALTRSYRALCEFRLEGVNHNLHFLCNLLRRLRLENAPLPTGFIEDHLPELTHHHEWQSVRYRPPERACTDNGETPIDGANGADGHSAVPAPCSGRVARTFAKTGDWVTAGETLAIIEAMKMEFMVTAPTDGWIRTLSVDAGAMVQEGQSVCVMEPASDLRPAVETEESVDLEAVRDDLAQVLERHRITRDEHRGEAVTKRHDTGMQTARENLDQLLDDASFQEYGALALAAQRQRRPLNELMERSPADGLVAGTGTINAERFGTEAARCVALAYDYTVFAGTQGMMNHRKMDRLLQLAHQWALPVVLFAEGGGGRPGDTDHVGVSGLDVTTFSVMASLSGRVPLVSVIAGRCFAGNAALAGCSDVIIATREATLGMAGPAMIEGGGLGRYSPEDVGPINVQAPNGVVDVVVANEAEAAGIARQYLAYFQGPLADWDCTDQRRLRHRIPENRLRAYDTRALINDLADNGSVLELREQFAPGLVTALVRIAGHAFGLIANNPVGLGGAINSDAADKAARFMQLCNASGLPMVSLCDTPGFMVGPDAEKQASVRHVSRLFVTGASLRVPMFAIVLRKAYGLGAQAMCGGSLHAPVFSAAWPTGEFGAMGLEGAVRLGYARELAAVDDPEERQALFERMVARAYEEGKALNTASFLEIDAVIDPAETRSWILKGLKSTGNAWRDAPRPGFIDTW